MLGAAASPPSGVGHCAGLRGDGNNLGKNHIDSGHKPGSEGLSLTGKDDGRVRVHWSACQDRERLSAVGRRLGQGGCALAPKLEVLDAELQHDVDIDIHLALGIDYLQHGLNGAPSLSQSASKGGQLPPSTGKLGNESEPAFGRTVYCQSSLARVVADVVVVATLPPSLRGPL